MEHIVNFASEKKLIFIGSYIHKYVGALIKEDPTCEGSNYRTMPIIDDDWQVVDKTYATFESDYGYFCNVLGREGDTVHITHPALQGAIESSSSLNYRSIEEIMCEALTYGVKFDNTGVQSRVLLIINPGFKPGTFTIRGTYGDAPDGNINKFRGSHYPMPSLTFCFGKEDKASSINLEPLTINLLKERLASDLYWYSYLFKDPDIRLSLRLNFDEKSLTKKQFTKLKEVETYVNNHLAGKDED